MILGFHRLWLYITSDEENSDADGKGRAEHSQKGLPLSKPVMTTEIPPPVPIVVTSDVTALNTSVATSNQPDKTIADTRVSWVYGLRKPQLEAELSKLGMPTDGNSQRLRAELVRLAKEGKAKSPLEETDFVSTQMLYSQAQHNLPIPSTHNFPSKSNLELEAEGVREILGLSPDADFKEVQRMLTTKRPSQRLDYQSGLTCRNFSLPRKESDPTHQYDFGGSRLTNVHSNAWNEKRTRAEPPRDQLNHSEVISHGMPETAVLCNMVRKWNLRFDGKRDSDAISFLERLNELVDAYEVQVDAIVRALPELLKDSALLWYRNNRDFWSGFTDFLRDFQLQYLPPGYLIHLDDEIRKRTQGEGELFRQYVVALSTLIRRRGGFSEVERLERIYANAHPSYKIYVRRRDFANLSGLMKMAEEYEACMRERQNYRPPPSPAQALVNETAFHGKNRNQSRPGFHMTAVTPSEPRFSNDKESRKGTFREPQEKREPQETPRNYVAQKNTGFQQSKEGKTHRSFTKTSENICWNCEKTGHMYRDCRQPKVLRCYNCKKPGVRTTSCDCKKQGNFERTTERGGHRSPSSRAH